MLVDGRPHHGWMCAALAALLLGGGRARADEKPDAGPPPSALQQWLSNPPPLSGGTGRRMMGAGIALAVVGLAAGGVGIGLLASSAATVASLNDPPKDTRWDPALVDGARTYQTAGLGCVIAGSVVFVAGVVIGAVGATRRSSQLRGLTLAPGASPGGASLSATLEF